eukprot:218449-Chlamydomonas_euryale.AAC.1
MCGSRPRRMKTKELLRATMLLRCMDLLMAVLVLCAMQLVRATLLLLATQLLRAMQLLKAMELPITLRQTMHRCHRVHPHIESQESSRPLRCSLA